MSWRGNWHQGKCLDLYISDLLEEDGEAWTVVEIADYLKASGSRCSEVLRELVASGHVERERERVGAKGSRYRFRWIGKGGERAAAE